MLIVWLIQQSASRVSCLLLLWKTAIEWVHDKQTSSEGLLCSVEIWFYLHTEGLVFFLGVKKSCLYLPWLIYGRNKYKLHWRGWMSCYRRCSSWVLSSSFEHCKVKPWGELAGIPTPRKVGICPKCFSLVNSLPYCTMTISNTVILSFHLSQTDGQQQLLLDSHCWSLSCSKLTKLLHFTEVAHWWILVNKYNWSE